MPSDRDVMMDSSSSIDAVHAAMRRELRQLLAECGIQSNPGWGDVEIVDALKRLLPAREACPHCGHVHASRFGCCVEVEGPPDPNTGAVPLCSCKERHA
jgi:hypothetical protein